MAHPSHLFFPTDVEGFDVLARLALNLQWLWNHSSDELWGQIDPELWALTHNPWVVLQTASRARLKHLLADPEFRAKLEDVLRAEHTRESLPTWFEETHPHTSLRSVAYFCMEFMLSEALPIYAGGLGNVAGDQLKAASALGVPVVGVGLLYQQGYFRQVLDAEGNQRALYPYNAPEQLQITPVRNANGEWLRMMVRLPGYKLWLRVWEARVGRLKLYLLDTNDPANTPTDRSYAAELYGGGPEARLVQEMILGLGGWRLLHELGIAPDVCHLNEGHAAFAVLERARRYMEATGCGFHVALGVTRAGNLFTTHTPVSAGFDRFPADLMQRYIGHYVERGLKISFDEFLALGRENPANSDEPFNMAYLAIRGSSSINGVSALHERVTRRIFHGLFPRWPEWEIPTRHVTNGIHVRSWQSEEAHSVWRSVCGHGLWRGKAKPRPEGIREASHEALWDLRTRGRKKLIAYVRDRLARQFASSGAPEVEIARAGELFNPLALTLGFARRFAAYKRPTLLLHNPERLLRIWKNPERPVQLILAGKAHPRDAEGQALVREWVRFIREHDALDHVVFVADYDMTLTRYLVQGVDIWLNNPRRPWEASGTSGMKILANGGLNLSALDGWWAEAFAPDVGWALGDALEHDNDPWRDAREAEEMYDLLEQEVIPMFYERDAQGIPRRWVARMRESMARLTPQFSADRTVREYTKEYYLPAAERFHRRAAENGRLGAELVEWQRSFLERAANASFGELRVKTSGENHSFQLHVHLAGLAPEEVRVELYANPVAGGQPELYPMRLAGKMDGSENGYTYRATVSAARPAEDFTARLLPYHPEAILPLELPWILWLR